MPLNPSCKRSRFKCFTNRRGVVASNAREVEVGGLGDVDDVWSAPSRRLS